MPQATSLGSVLVQSIDRFGDRVAIMIPPAKGEKGFTSLTYREWGDRVRRTAAVLRQEGVDRGDRVAILSESSASWAAADWALLSIGATVVAIYPSLPADQARPIADDADVTLVLVADAKGAEKMTGHRTMLLSELDERAVAAHWPDEEWRAEIALTRPEDLATIIYTSGTTGVPKGVMLPHRALCHFVEAVPRALKIDENDVWLSILPQSHIYERAAGQFLPLAIGATLAFSKSLASIGSDLLAVKPTVLLCVPRFLESFRERILDSVDKMPKLRQFLFWRGLSAGHAHAQKRFSPLFSLMNKLVLSKLRERTGGRLRYMISGGAALPRHVAEFFMAIDITILQGYGLTETCGGTVCNRPERNKYWTIGEPIETEARLAADGELELKGDMVFDGYWNRPEETAAAFTEDGWYKTGDIAEWEGESLKITDRKKDLLVLGNGKNVAPQPIENALLACPHVASAVVLGDGMDACVALIVPRFELFRKDAGLSDDAVVTEEAMRPTLKKEIDAINATLAGHEKVKRFGIIDHPFSIEEGTLTPTLKVRRKAVSEKYANLIKTLR